MIDKNKMVKVINKFSGTVGYDVPEMGVHRNFYPKESKEISFEELERLSFIPGGDVILRNHLEIVDEDVIMALFNEKPEPEYHYSENDVKQLKNVKDYKEIDEMIDVYCRGVNYWANTHYLPIEYYILGAKFENWTKTDICV